MITLCLSTLRGLHRLEVVELSNEAIPGNEVLFFTHWKSKKRE
ncbi:neurolysin (metallopeptidase M3 family), isoform CRA_b [Rattus norvegicus]|uniref:Neurolysin (Metallopeptidase M3 family), isoform CRA_b n=1 Tax=Rattus norvegicus TaxID=10116 RepID=A6I5E7_RAT|nr:neurolysin (metallopeptidase M3 family), isoform CRA_b [Rattus norvegicus]